MSAGADGYAARPRLVVLGVGTLRVGVPLERAERLERTVAITPLPGAPHWVAGVIDVAGRMVPVFDTARRLGLPARAQHHDDVLLLATSRARRVALTADAVFGLEALDEATFDAMGGAVPGVPHLRGVARRADGLVLVTDLDAFLSDAEHAALDDALARAEPAR